MLQIGPDGSIAKRIDTSASDIDLMRLSDQVSYADTFAALEAASSRLGRKVNPTIFTSKEFYKRVKAEESFLTRVLAQPLAYNAAHALCLAALRSHQISHPNVQI